MPAFLNYILNCLLVPGFPCSGRGQNISPFQGLRVWVFVNRGFRCAPPTVIIVSPFQGYARVKPIPGGFDTICRKLPDHWQDQEIKSLSHLHFQIGHWKLEMN
jgi:hypothetical protein